MNRVKVATNHEMTKAPYWMIIDPRQNLSRGNKGVHNIADMIAGPFFSRESAEEFLERTRYNFGKNARVYCLSGHHSAEWCEAVANGEKQ